MAVYTDSRTSFANSRKKLISRQTLLSDTALLVYLALLKFLAHLVVSGNYGFFRDELYYIDAGKHLAFGYVEFPPFIALLAVSIHTVIGNSLVAYHLFPAMSGAVLVLLTGLIARELGGGRFAQCLAALASLSVLTFLAIDSIFSMDSFDELWWVLMAYILIRLIKRDRPRLWLLFGLVAGIGLMTKVTMLMFGFAIVAGLLLTPQRKYLLNKWAWAGGAIAFAFLVPYVLWNAANGWPTLEFWSTYTSGHANPASALGFLYQQILTMNPLTLPLWLAGLYYYFFTQAGKPYRAFGWAYVILYVLFTVTRAKLYFLAPAYPMLFAAGSVLIGRIMSRPRLGWLKPAYISLLLLVGLLLAPTVMPILPPSLYGRATAIIGGNAGIKVENRATGVLPQQLADRFGWDTMTAAVARVYHSLPQDEQAQACIFTENYGEAGAIDFYGSQYHLPQAISGHNTYYLWGPGNCTGAVVISIGNPLSMLQPAFASVTQADTITCAYCMPAENDLPVYVCLHLKSSIQAIWPSVKHYS
ncbi:MAG TPA: glycosyltransferase family 39 protein [Ktedonobacteraceae bacterium]|nr:glycosyltransferase family 39 protein [Ktedonobacteraceae bacterium]